MMPFCQSTNKKYLLEKLYKQYATCVECPLSKQGRKTIVFGKGNPTAKIMFIGEAPGKEEDITGIPFVGRAGKLLTSLINQANISFDDIYITNIVKCRPPNNRTPLPIERTTCSSNILFNEIKTINPIVICTLGNSATQGILGPDKTISQTRGQWLFSEKTGSIKILPTYHPAYLLRSPKQKIIFLEDLAIIKQAINNKS